MVGNLKLADEAGSPTGWIRQAAPSRIFAAAGFGLLCLFALIVLTRRGLGAFSGSITPFGYLLCLLLASVACCMLKVAAEWPPHQLPRRASIVFGALLGLPLDALAVALLPSDWTYLGLLPASCGLTLVGWFCMSSQSCVYTRWLISEVVWPEVERFLCPAGPRPTTVPNKPEPTNHETSAEPSRESMIALARSPFADEAAPVWGVMNFPRGPRCRVLGAATSRDTKRLRQVAALQGLRYFARAVMRRVMYSRTWGILVWARSLAAEATSWPASGSAAYQYMSGRF